MFEFTEQDVNKLRKILRGCEQQVLVAEQEAERLRHIAAHLRAVLHALESGRDWQPLPLEQDKVNSEQVESSPARSATSPVPARRQQYADLSMLEAVEQILRNKGGIQSGENLAREIFEIKNDADLFRAKRSLSSELSKGVRGEKWRRVGKSSYTMEKPEEQTRQAESDMRENLKATG